MLERRNDTVVIDGVGHVIGLILEIVRRIAHGDTDIDGVHQRDVIAGVADAVYGSGGGDRGRRVQTDAPALRAFAGRDFGYLEFELVKDSSGSSALS